MRSLLESGVHVLAVEYHINQGKFTERYPEFPQSLTEIRLESFAEELNKYLLVHGDRIDSNCIGLFGTSKGGELALLLGSLYPQFKFVVGIVPGNVAFQSSKTSLFQLSSWSHGGRAVPFVQAR
jgi:dienelactone hydrolase